MVTDARSVDLEPMWLTTTEVAQRLSVNVRTLERWRKQGIGPSFSRRNGIIRYDARILDDWMRRGANVQDEG